MLIIEFFSFSSIASTQQKPISNKSAIIATVNQAPIYLLEAEQALSEFAASQQLKKIPSFHQLSDKQKEQIIRSIAVDKLLDQAIHHSGIQKEKEIQANIEEMINQYIKQSFLLRKAKETVTPKVVRNYYDTLSKELKGKEEFHLKQIFTSSAEEAISLHTQLIKKPKEFESLAKQFSKDEYAKNGGDIGYVVETLFSGELKDVITNLAKNTISQPVQSKDGWHIFKLVDRRKVTIPPFATLKAQIEQELTQKAIQDYLKQLLDKASFELSLP